MSEPDACEPQRYVVFVRDSWGIARRQGEPREMTVEEAESEPRARQQMQMGWLVPESEAENVR